MPIFDYSCERCNLEKEVLQVHDASEWIMLCECGGLFRKMAPQSAPSFELRYNNKTDMVDWFGNKSSFYNSYKEAKARGENVRIPELDGDPR